MRLGTPLPALRRRGDQRASARTSACGCRCFQVSTGISIVLLNGTLNRVMIVELGVSTLLVSLMVSLPLVFAPFRVLIGFKSDNHRSVLGWRRVPYIWMGTLVQFGGFAILPFALLVLSGTGEYPGQSMDSSARRSRFCWSAPGCIRRRPRVLALATDLAPRRVAARGWSHSSM